MKKNEKRALGSGIIFTSAFVVFTVLVQIVDVKPFGQNGTNIGFADFNCWFHKLTGVNMTIYTITDWLGLVPLFICMVFGILGLIQLIKRRSLLKVDKDIMILGVYYIVVIAAYIFFEIIPINYRPILIDGVLEASYPSSTTLLVVCVMPTLVEQLGRRMKDSVLKKVILVITVSFSVYMVLGRLISGVHWFTDIFGALLLSAGLFGIYKGLVLFICGED